MKIYLISGSWRSRFYVEEVFGGLLGLAREELARLVEAGVIA